MTREIQDYLVEKAQKNDVPIIPLHDYLDAENQINRVIFDCVKELVEKCD